MKFAPEYVTHVLNDNFEDAKALLLSPMIVCSSSIGTGGTKTRMELGENSTCASY